MTPERPLDAFHTLLARAHRDGATRLFLLPDEPPALRKAGGAIERLDAPPVDDGWLHALCADIVGGEAALVGPFGELTRWYELPGVTHARCVVARAGGRLSLVAAPTTGVVPTPERVRMPPPLLAAAETGVGLVVFGGLSGSGKTTSALTLVEHFNANAPCHVCTVEDPIEVRFEPKQALVQQRQVGLDVPNTVAGIRAAMRQDLDVLYVAEVKSVEELQACVTAAASGHLVITQLNAGDVGEVIRRIVDSYPEELRDGARRNLAQVLTAVCVQRLLPRTQGGEHRGRVAAYAWRVFDDDARRAVAAGRDPMADTTAPAERRVAMAEALRDLRDRGEIDQETLHRALLVDRGRL